MCFSVMLLHCTCSKIHLCFLATLKNIASGFSFPILARFISKMFTRMHCISSHGLENGSRQWHLLNIHFSSPKLCSKMKEVSIPSEVEQHWDWLLAPGSQDADTQLWEMSRQQLCKRYSFSWNVNPAPLRGVGKLQWSRQDKVCRALGGFMLQEAEGHEKEGLWTEHRKRGVIWTDWQETSPQCHHLALWAIFMPATDVRVQMNTGSFGMVRKWMWEWVEMLTIQRDAKMHGLCLKAFTKLLPPGKTLLCSSSVCSLCSAPSPACAAKGCAELSVHEWNELRTVGYL